MTARHFGLDLAWSSGNLSGVCALDDQGRVVDERLLGNDDAIIGWVADHLDGPAVVAADIPLRVPNFSGARPCDRRLASAYGRRRAGPHPANRTIFLGRDGRVRGEDLSRRFADLDFGDLWEGTARTLIEVYPHPGLVEVFGLPERLLYKKGPLAVRRRGLAQLRSLLAGLLAADPPLVGPHIPIPRQANGTDLKAIEDMLDARFCAWTAALWSHSDGRRVRVFGDAGTGHIAVPLG